MIEKVYVIIPANDLTESMIEESCNQKYTFRTSLDESKVILKFCMKYPNTVSGYPKYSHTEILEYLATNSAEW